LDVALQELGWVIPGEKPMLPIGHWPREERGGHGGNGSGTFAIPERFIFIKNLGPNFYVPGISFGRKYDYWGFVFEGVAVVESVEYANATYLFRVDRANSWLKDVEYCKFLIWSRKRGENFIKKIHHTGSWRRRLVEQIKKHRSSNRSSSRK